MYKAILGGLFALLLLTGSAAAQSCSGATYTTLTNGSTADATQVMGNFTCVLSSPSFSGPVGIGMTPTYALDITQNNPSGASVSLSDASTSSMSAAQYRLQNGTNQAELLMYGTGFGSTGIACADGARLSGGGGGGLTLDAGQAQPIYFGINGSEVGRFDSSGYLDVGTTATGGYNGNGRVNSQVATGQAFSGYNSGTQGNVARFRLDNTGPGYFTFDYQATAVGSITTNGTSTSFNTTSDERLKTDLGILDAVPDLVALKVHSFLWKTTKKLDVGLFAQEAYKVVPDIVRKGGADPKKDPWQVNYLALIPRLLVGWQNQEKRIDALEKENALLVARVKVLSAARQDAGQMREQSSDLVAPSIHNLQVKNDNQTPQISELTN